LKSLEEMISNVVSVERKFEDEKFIPMIIQYKNGHSNTDEHLFNFLTDRENVLLFQEKDLKKAQEVFFEKLINF
jgi:hypothetical protein